MWYRQLARHAVNESVITAYGAIEIAAREVLDLLGIDKDNFTPGEWKPSIIYEKLVKDLESDKSELLSHEGLLKEVDAIFNHEKSSHFINSNKLGMVQCLGIIAAVGLIPSRVARDFRGLASLRNDLIHRAKTITEEQAADFLDSVFDLLMALIIKLNEDIEVHVPVFLPIDQEIFREIMDGDQEGNFRFFYPLEQLLEWLRQQFFKEHVRI